jgi:hypothetical protein
MNSSPENHADLRDIRRYEKSASVLRLGLIVLVVLTAPFYARGLNPFDFSWAKAAPVLPGLFLLAAAHFFQRRLLKRKADEARQRLALRAGKGN